MAESVRTDKAGPLARLNLNSDGKPHTWLNAAAVLTLVDGLLAFALGLLLRTGPGDIHTWAIVASVTGLVAILVGLISQMMSATREERIVIVIGMIAGFIGVAIGLAHGGFS